MQPRIFFEQYLHTNFGAGRWGHFLFVNYKKLTFEHPTCRQ